MALTLKKIARLGEGRHFDRDGVYLDLSETGNGSWLLRIPARRPGALARSRTAAGFRHWTEARERARKARQLLRDGLDPIDAKREQRTRQKLEAARSITFEIAARRYYDAHQVKWSVKHREAFLEHAAAIRLPEARQAAGRGHRHRPGTQGDRADLGRQARHRRRIRAQSRCAGLVHRARLPDGDNPARWRGHLKEALPSKVVAVVNHPALHYDEVPAFVQQLSKHQGVGPRALEFIILTAARTGEALGARWSEIDFEKKIWTVPASG